MNATPPPRPRILYLHMTALGDAIMSSPALRVLRDHYPDAVITVLARKAALSYFRSLSSVDEVIPFVDEKFIDRRRPWRLLGAGKDLLRVLKALRSHRWDAVLQWRSQLPDTLLAAWCRARVKVLGIQRVHRPARFGAEQMRFIYSTIVETRQAGVHLVEAFAAPSLHLVEHSTGRRPALHQGLEYPLTPRDHDEAARFLGQHKVSPTDHLVLLSISTKTSYNQWLDCRYTGIADAIQAMGFRVVLSGLPEHLSREEDIAKQMLVPPLRSTGVLSMGGVAALLTRCHFAVALNTGICHVAAALKVPIMVLNGRDGADITPWQVESEIVTGNEHYPRRHPDPSQWSGLVQKISVHQACEGVERLVAKIANRPALSR